MRSARILVAVLRLLWAARIPGASTSYPLVTRSEWGALPPVITPLNCTLPVPFVVIHHSYIPSACTTRDTCSQAMRAMQQMHQLVNGWNDIGYNFAIGGDGSVYEGRGWDIVGAHAPKYNFMSVGVCFVGDYRTELPSAGMLDAARQLILEGVDRGSTHPNYTLVGHRQVRETECPGDALFQEIQTWMHWKPVKDIQPRSAVAGPSLAAGSNSTGPSVTDNLADSNNTGPSVTDNLSDSSNTRAIVTDNLSDSSNTGPIVTDNLSISNNTGPSVTVDLFISNNDIPNITDSLYESSNTVPNIADNLSDSNNNLHNITGNFSDSNNTGRNDKENLYAGNNNGPNTKENLSDSNNDIERITDTLPDRNDTMSNVTASLPDSDSTVQGLPP